MNLGFEMGFLFLVCGFGFLEDAEEVFALEAWLIVVRGGVVRAQVRIGETYGLDDLPAFVYYGDCLHL